MTTAPIAPIGVIAGVAQTSFLYFANQEILAYRNSSLGIKHSIDGADLYIALTESHSSEVQYTMHPVQAGDIISDHAIRRPMKFEIEGFISDNNRNELFPPSQSQMSQSQVPSLKLYRELFNILHLNMNSNDGSINGFKVITGKKVYDNAFMTKLEVQDNIETEHALRFKASFIVPLFATFASLHLSNLDLENQKYPEVQNTIDNQGLKVLKKTKQQPQNTQVSNIFFNHSSSSPTQQRFLLQKLPLGSAFINADQTRLNLIKDIFTYHNTDVLDLIVSEIPLSLATNQEFYINLNETTYNFTIVWHGAFNKKTGVGENMAGWFLSIKGPATSITNIIMRAGVDIIESFHYIGISGALILNSQEDPTIYNLGIDCKLYYVECV